MSHPQPAAGADPPAGAPAPTGDGGTTAAAPLIREWHTMTPDERDTEWTALVDWVIWIHDLYELAKEERLPLCWPRHPGLVEELRSLKAWRDAVYDNPTAAGSPHTARSWHGELRQTIDATTTFWAPTCRAGHTDAHPLNRAHPNLDEQWRAAGPPVMDSAPEPQQPPATTMTDQDMAAALHAGTAQPHSRNMPQYTHHDGSWWTRAPNGATWDRCVNDAHAARLDDTSARMRAADAAVDRIPDRKEQPPCQN